MTDSTETVEETEEGRLARNIAAFAARGQRYARLAESLVGAKDPSFALAVEMVDLLARVDSMVERIAHLEFVLDQLTKGER